jgi:thioredoxin 1
MAIILQILTLLICAFIIKNRLSLRFGTKTLERKDKMELVINDQNFDEEVLGSSTPVLVDFWAEWCGPCKMVSPAVTELAEEMKDHLKVGKLNVDENPDSTSRYQVFSIPALKVFKEGKIIGEIVGAAPKHVIEQRLKTILGI